jgi:hypothetical protein
MIRLPARKNFLGEVLEASLIPFTSCQQRAKSKIVSSNTLLHRMLSRSHNAIVQGGHVTAGFEAAEVGSEQWFRVTFTPPEYVLLIPNVFSVLMIASISL